MSSAIVVRRYKCMEETRELKKTTLHQAILQIAGPTDQEMYVLSRELSKSDNAYKIACNCSQCISFKEEVRTGSFPTTEPLVKALGTTFNLLCTFDYKLKTSSTVHNCDGSNSTTWVWVKDKISSEI